MLHRRKLLVAGLAAPLASITAAVRGHATDPLQADSDSALEALMSGRNGWDDHVCRRILGAANEPKEGDQIVGVAAADSSERQKAREILLQTRLATIDR
ncbi:MAG: ethanolamine ammonia-lyase subunit EutB, partial [Planctomycetaceae bacterium]